MKTIWQVPWVKRKESCYIKKGGSARVTHQVKGGRKAVCRDDMGCPDLALCFRSDWEQGTGVTLGGGVKATW